MIHINQLVNEMLLEHNFYRDGESDEIPFQHVQTAFPFRARNPENKISAPELAYKILYKKAPKEHLWPIHYSNTKIWNGMVVASILEDDWLNKLASIKSVQIRSISPGYSLDRPAYIILRPLKQSEKYISDIVNKLTNCSPKLKAGFDLGNNQLYRVCVVGKVFYKPEKNEFWNEWWETTIDCLKKVL